MHSATASKGIPQRIYSPELSRIQFSTPEGQCNLLTPRRLLQVEIWCPVSPGRGAVSCLEQGRLAHSSGGFMQPEIFMSQAHVSASRSLDIPSSFYSNRSEDLFQPMSVDFFECFLARNWWATMDFHHDLPLFTRGDALFILDARNVRNLLPITSRIQRGSAKG